MPAADIRFAAALAGAIALGPLLTIAAAGAVRESVERERAELKAKVEARFADERARSAAAALLRSAVRGAPLAVTLDRIARALPADARLVSGARDAGNGLRIEVATSDPDRLRGMLRRDPLFAAMREIGQRRTADARVVVTLAPRR